MFLGQCTYSRGTPQTLHIQISWWANPTSGRQILSLEIFLLSVRSQARLALDTAILLCRPQITLCLNSSLFLYCWAWSVGGGPQHSLVATVVQVSQQAAFRHGEGRVQGFHSPIAGLEYHAGVFSATVPKTQPQRAGSNGVSSQSSGNNKLEVKIQRACSSCYLIKS